MQTMNLKIDDKFFPYFKAMIDSLVKDNKVEILDDTISANNFSKELLLDTKEEVQKKVFEAENRINKGEYLSEEDYEKSMNRFFKEELGIARLQMAR